MLRRFAGSGASASKPVISTAVQAHPRSSPRRRRKDLHGPSVRQEPRSPVVDGP
jgi:hypothetical protein